MKLVLIDGNAILHRAYHAMPPFTTLKGEPIGAVHGFVSILLKTINDLKPTHLIVAFDEKEPTFRHEEFEDYQAHRPAVHDDLISQFPKVRDVVRAFGIPIFSKVGFEADDVLGTIARKAQGKVGGIVIVTGDKDILQLVNDKVQLYMPQRGLGDSQLIGSKEAKKKIGVMPKQVVDFKALVGDPSDNYKGVPGIGPKTAITLLQEYETLEGIYTNLDKVPDRIANLLKEHKASAFQSQKLAKIVTDIKIKFDLGKASDWQIENPKISKLFSDFGFKTLSKRVTKTAREVAKKRQEKLF